MKMSEFAQKCNNKTLYNLVGQFINNKKRDLGVKSVKQNSSFCQKFTKSVQLTTFGGYF